MASSVPKSPLPPSFLSTFFALNSSSLLPQSPNIIQAIFRQPSNYTYLISLSNSILSHSITLRVSQTLTFDFCPVELYFIKFPTTSIIMPSVLSSLRKAFLPCHATEEKVDGCTEEKVDEGTEELHYQAQPIPGIYMYKPEGRYLIAVRPRGKDGEDQLFMPRPGFGDAGKVTHKPGQLRSMPSCNFYNAGRSFSLRGPTHGT